MKKVLVIGDGCQDIFIYGSCPRLSPEAPVPVFHPQMQVENGGMAVNVYNNLVSLGVDCDIITYSGITKTRYVDMVSNQLLLRVDENDAVSFHNKPDWDEVIDRVKQYDIVVISDYNKGFLSKELISEISVQVDLTFLDSKKKLGRWADLINFIKLNEKEYRENLEYLDYEYPNTFIVTHGGNGASLHTHEEGIITSRMFPITEHHPVRDLSGAGDTFMAGFVARYLETQNLEESIEFANKCASWVVTQKGVVTVKRDKIDNV